MEGRTRWGELRFMFLGFALCVGIVEGSIHEYRDGSFTPQLNSYFFHGGSEGLYASKNETSSNGKSFVQFESVTFRRTKEAAARHGDMEQKTGLIEAIIVEIKDREKIGGAYLNSDAICCTTELSKDGSCRRGEVIIH